MGGGDRMAGMCPFISHTLIPLLSYTNTLSDNNEVDREGDEELGHQIRSISCYRVKFHGPSVLITT